MELGELIAELRSDKGLSQRELGKIINKSNSTICNYEKGVHIPDVETMLRLADSFDVSIDFLLQRTKYKYSIKYLNNHLSSDFTLGDLLNTIIQLDPSNRNRLVDYISLLTLRNDISKRKKKMKDSE